MMEMKMYLIIHSKKLNDYLKGCKCLEEIEVTIHQGNQVRKVKIVLEDHQTNRVLNI